MREQLFINSFYTLKNCISLKFLNKIFKSKIYVNKITGSLIFKKFYNEEKILKIWEQRYLNAKKKKGGGGYIKVILVLIHIF